MAKRNKKITINITEEYYKMLEHLAKGERRSNSELAALILCDNVQELFLQNQKHGDFKKVEYIPSKF